jgi:toxin ParE1/3/4
LSARLVLSPEAAADLREIVDFIAEDNPAAARRFLSRLRAEMDRLATTPGIGHRREDLTGSPVLFWPIGRSGRSCAGRGLLTDTAARRYSYW